MVMGAYKFESDNITDILKYLEKNTLFVLDIDHTLIEPVQAIGSTHWEKHLTKKLLAEGFTHHEACIRAFHQWRTIQHLTDVKTIQDSIYDVTKYIRSNQINTLGLTSRDGTLPNLTFDQLKSVHLHEIFSIQNAPSDLTANYPCAYFNGTVFCGFNKKDEAFKLFLQHIQLNPTKVVFIDDQQSHIEELEDITSRLGIEYVGMKYTASGDHTFDSKIADIQEKHLPKLLSNREALDLLEA